MNHTAQRRRFEWHLALHFIPKIGKNVWLICVMTPESNPESHQGTAACNAELLLWLHDVGVEKYAECFQRAGLRDLNSAKGLLAILGDEDLKAMGVATIGARIRIRLAVAEEKENSRETKKLKTSHLDSRPSNAAMNVFFNQNNNNKLGCSPPPPSTTTTTAKTTTTKKKRSFTNKTPTAPTNTKKTTHYAFRNWQLIAGTSFIVDRFCSLPPSTPANRHWFLTHFHSDHYRGITSKFNRGMIYCTPVTAALVQLQLRLPLSTLRPISIGESLVIENTRVTFLPANHCPGAAMILFEPSGRRPVLHTGDARLTRGIAHAIPQLQQLRGNIDLILDTTYCDPQYTFPPQSEVLDFVVDAVKAETFNPNTLFMFGSYTIGKEKLYLQAAKVLKCKIYVSATKKKVLDCIDLSPEEKALLTTDDSETNLHAVPLRMISYKHMENTLKYYRGRFVNIVGFQPTGWTHERETAKTKKGGGRGRRRQKGTLITYQVPYSEHSSFTELKEFVDWLRPRSILPHVNNDGEHGPKTKRMLDLLRGGV